MVAFKKMWDTELQCDEEVAASREAGVKYAKKGALRRALIDAALAAGVIKTEAEMSS